MFKKLMLLVAIFTSMYVNATALEAKRLPVVPENCFDQAVYCSDWEILQKDNDVNPHGERVIRVKMFFQVDGFNYENDTELIKRFFNFTAWPDYTRGSDVVTLEKSIELPGTVDLFNRKVYRHEAFYSIKGPRIIGGNVNIRELANYWQLETVPGALSSWSMSHEVGYKAQGIKHKTGHVHISYNEETEVYLGHVVLDIIPEINILPKVAAPFIQDGLLTLFARVFNLEI